MAAEVKVAVRIDDRGVVTGLNQIDQAGQKLNGSLERAGRTGNVVMTRLANDAHRSNAAVNLLSRTIGIEVPRALEGVISRSALGQKAIAAAFNVTVAAAFAQIVATVVVNAIQKAIEVVKAFDDAVASMHERQAGIANRIIREAAEGRKKLEIETEKIGLSERFQLNVEWAARRDEMLDARRKAIAAGDVNAVKAVNEEIAALDADFRAQIGAARDKERAEESKRIIDEEQRRISEKIALAEAGARATAEISKQIGVLIGADEIKRREEQAKASMDMEQKLGIERARIRKREADEAARLAKQMAEEHRRAVEQMADELGRFIDDPIRYIKDQWKRMLLTMVAEWILSMRGVGGPQGAGGRGGGLGGIFGGIFGGGGGVFGLPGTTPPTFPGPSNFGQSFLGGLGFGTGLSAGQGFGMGFVPPGQERGGSQQQRGLLDRLFSRGFQSEQYPGLGSALGMAGVGLGILGFTRGSPFIGAAGGALAGFQIGGPIGAVIGGIVGLFAGIFGRGRKRRQRDDLERQAFAQIKLIEDAYNFHQMDYLSARNSLEQLRAQVDQGMKQLGWSSRMNPHIDSAINRMNATEQERQRRAGLTVSPPIFERGGFIGASVGHAASGPGANFSGFGPAPVLRNSVMPRFDQGGAVGIVAHRGEFVVNARATSRNRAALERINSGGMGGGMEVHFHVGATDPEAFIRWLRNGGTEQVAREFRRASSEGAI